MAFIDELKIYLEAGRGGDGVVRWLHEKGKEYGGPAGGNGGRGGDVYVRAIRDIGALASYRATKSMTAGRGRDGGKAGKHGKSGFDLVVNLPVGSVVRNLSTDRRVELVGEGEKFLLLSGGRSGLGNKHFKSSFDTRPKKWTPGEKGERALFSVELMLIADAGLVGLPNAGKTSLLNALTSAHAKVGDYPFTTLEPNLGELHGFIIADIPGLIEGAAEGRGLGYKFLRHVRRTKIIIHCLSFEEDDLALAYKTVRAELEKYDTALVDKKEIIVLTKADLVQARTTASRSMSARLFGRDVFVVSIYDTKSVKKFSDELVKILRAF